MAQESSPITNIFYNKKKTHLYYVCKDSVKAMSLVTLDSREVVGNRRQQIINAKLNLNEKFVIVAYRATQVEESLSKSLTEKKVEKHSIQFYAVNIKNPDESKVLFETEHDLINF